MGKAALLKGVPCGRGVVLGAGRVLGRVLGGAASAGCSHERGKYRGRASPREVMPGGGVNPRGEACLGRRGGCPVGGPTCEGLTIGPPPPQHLACTVPVSHVSRSWIYAGGSIRSSNFGSTEGREQRRRQGGFHQQSGSRRVLEVKTAN